MLPGKILTSLMTPAKILSMRVVKIYPIVMMTWMISGINSRTGTYEETMVDLTNSHGKIEEIKTTTYTIPDILTDIKMEEGQISRPV